MSKMSWEMFKQRKNINEPEWIRSKGLTTYQEFCDELIKLGIRIPLVSIEERLFPKKQEIVEEIQKQENRKPRKRIRENDIIAEHEDA